ncbi:MAG: phosphoserine phosphatase SerB [Pseudomonadota bacterium]
MANSESDAVEELLLLHVSGQDRRGLLAELTGRLASGGVQVLDIGQAIVHEQLVLSILARFVGSAANNALLLRRLSTLAEERGVSLRYSTVGSDDYEHWVRGQGQDRYILTLLSAGVDAGNLAAVSEVISRHGLNVYAVSRLSNRVALVDVENSKRSSLEMTLRGRIADEDALKRDLLAAASAYDFDCSIQLDSVYRRNRRLVAFDMDSTLIRAEVIDELARRHGVYDAVAAITARAMAGELDFAASLRERVGLLRGLPASTLSEVAASVELSDGAERLLLALGHFGYRTAILSGGFQPIGEDLARRLGIDHVFANRLQIRDGVLTGELDGEIIDAEAKARKLIELCAAQGISVGQAIALGDGANDLPMLATAGLGIAFHAKPLVKESADHSISRFGLDSVLYLLGFSDAEIEFVTNAEARRQSEVVKS